MMVYLAARSPLRLVPWDDAAPSFYVGELAPDEVRVRVQFDSSHVVYAGSHEGCGCGFQYGKWPTGSRTPSETEMGESSKAAFAAYLERELASVGPIEVFACWDGDQVAPPEHRRILSANDLRSAEFFFLEKEKSVVTDTGIARDG